MEKIYKVSVKKENIGVGQYFWDVRWQQPCCVLGHCFVQARDCPLNEIAGGGGLLYCDDHGLNWADVSIANDARDWEALLKAFEPSDIELELL